MSAQFKDYKRGPGFWFLFEMLVASDICDEPLLSAKHSDFKAEHEDIYGMLNDGLKAYERINMRKFYKEW